MRKPPRNWTTMDEISGTRLIFGLILLIIPFLLSVIFSTERIWIAALWNYLKKKVKKRVLQCNASASTDVIPSPSWETQRKEAEEIQRMKSPKENRPWKPTEKKCLQTWLPHHHHHQATSSTHIRHIVSALHQRVPRKSKRKFFQEIFGHFLTSFQKQQKNIKVYATRVHCS